jgi:hypothetical protein
MPQSQCRLLWLLFWRSVDVIVEGNCVRLGSARTSSLASLLCQLGLDAETRAAAADLAVS